MRTRWICVGAWRADSELHYLRCRGYWMNWRGGNAGWCQPHEFKNFTEIAVAVRLRLEMAGLELVASASRLPRTEYQELWVEVRRKNAE